MNNRAPDTLTPAPPRCQHGAARCPCPEYRQAESRYDKRRRYLTATGQPLLVPAAPVAVHLRQLFDSGPGWTQISTATGLSTSTIHKILGGQQRIRRTVAARALAVRHIDTYAARRPVDATGSIRRIRALMAIGHTCLAIREAAGLDHSVVADLVNARTTHVYTSTDRKLRAAYKQLAYTPGGSVRNRRRAAREGWASPLRWDETTIDDPNARPDTDGHRTTPARQLGGAA